MPETHISPDWLSFSFWPILPDTDELDRQRERLRQLHVMLLSAGSEERFSFDSEPAYRKPFDRRHPLVSGGGSFYFRNTLKYASVEFTGQGCQRLYKKGAFNMIAGLSPDKVTRFDIAVDIRTDTMPRDFIAAGYSNRIKTTGEASSETGQTCYLGSPKSDVMARVYRYNSPHPRHEFLRIEFQTRGKRAQQAIRLWLEHGPIKTAQHVAASFQFAHPEWELESARLEPVPSQTKRDSKTMQWLVKQVRPAMLRLLTENSCSNEWWHDFFEGLPHCTFSYDEPGSEEVRDNVRGEP